jgi:hypothetical protein
MSSNRIEPRRGSAVYRTKRRFVEGNLERALSEEERPGAERKLTGKEKALLVATACASPPQGRARWTLRLLADAMVKLTEHKGLSGETVRRRLAENDLNLGARTSGAFPRLMANTLPAWKTYSTSMPKRPIPNDRWCASTKARSSSSATGHSVTLIGMVAAVAVVSSTIGTKPVPWWVWNASESVPIGLYAVQPVDGFMVTDLVVAMPPEPLARLLAEGGYLPRGVSAHQENSGTSWSYRVPK